jgi:phosphatidylglycerophosphate synthase
MNQLSPTPRLLPVIPNALSLARLVLGLVFPWLPDSAWLWVVLAGGLTDLIDGTLSRLLNAASVFGRILDPIADKVFVLAVVFTLVVRGALEPWEVLLVGLRDLAVLSGAAWVVLRRAWPVLGRMPPTWLGKATTAAQFAFIVVVLLARGQSLDRGWVLAALTVTALLSGLAAADYIRRFIAIRRGGAEGWADEEKRPGG